MKTRKLKFRAWDHIAGNMVYNFEETFDHHSTQHYFPVINSDGELHVGVYDENKDWHELSLMQSTGFKDRKGKEIYEGDILRSQGQNEKYIQVVEFHNTANTCGRGWIGRNIIKEENFIRKTPAERIDDRFSYFELLNVAEVIGNIHENPELV